ncbi:MAG TPA: hypothetical protein VGG65_06910 [Thermoanaerobaculia bacterium]
MTLLLSLLFVAAALLLVSGLGVGVGAAFLPPDRAFFLERLGWGDALGCAVLIASVPPALASGASPRIAFVVLAGVVVAVAGRFRLGLPPAPSDRAAKLPGVLLVLIAAGVAVYALRALTEPMWANDFIAIWGLKGKTIFLAKSYPERFFTDASLRYSHPEYPLGLPLLYAGLSFLAGRWDDQALALLFPFLQAATLLVLYGWLRRRGAAPAAAGLATATVGWFEPLYSGFLTGMAEVPLAFGMLLFGTAPADTLDEPDAGAPRRLVLASALLAATKNEGLFLALAGFLIALAFGKGERWRAAACTLVPALFVRALHFPWRSRLLLADLEARLFSMDRVWDALAAAGKLPGPAAWMGLALVVVLIAAGGRVPAGNRLLLLAAVALAAYLVIPSLAVLGPAWLIETTLRRTAAALVPLLAAAIGVRFTGASSGSGTGLRASAANPGPPPLSTPAS